MKHEYNFGEVFDFLNPFSQNWKKVFLVLVHLSCIYLSIFLLLSVYLFINIYIYIYLSISLPSQLMPLYGEQSFLILNFTVTRKKGVEEEEEEVEEKGSEEE